MCIRDRLERIKNVCLKFCGLSETLEQSLPGRGSFRENLRAGRLSVAGGEDTGCRVSASARERVEARYEAAQAIFDACEGDKYASEVARLEGDFDAQLRELLRRSTAARTSSRTSRACAPGWTSTSSTRSDRAASTPDKRAGGE